MSRLIWGQSEDRRYENGLDRGVLYPSDGDGVVWNGLTSVDEIIVGGELNSNYFDGIRYANQVGGRNFQAKLRALSVPRAFGPCVGEVEVKPGFILTRQPKQQFGLSYRTRVNGDVGYKIHLVYNATATSPGRGYSTKNSTPAPTVFEWTIDAVPPPSLTFRPTPHFVIDSTRCDPYVLEDLESFLYGTESTAPALPPQADVIHILNNLLSEPLSEPV